MVNVVQPVFAGGRIVNGNRLAALGVDAGENRARLARNDVLLKTEEQYWRVVTLDKKLKPSGHTRPCSTASSAGWKPPTPPGWCLRTTF